MESVQLKLRLDLNKVKPARKVYRRSEADTWKFLQPGRTPLSNWLDPYPVESGTKCVICSSQQSLFLTVRFSSGMVSYASKCRGVDRKAIPSNNPQRCRGHAEVGLNLGLLERWPG